MCVIAAKYFKDYGWVGVKNRDRTYKPNILIKKSHRDNIDRIYIWDENTRYTEGLNENGTSILNASFGRNSDYGKGEKDEEDPRPRPQARHQALSRNPSRHRRDDRRRFS